MKKALCIIFTMLTLIASTAFADTEAMKIQYDGKTVEYTAAPMTVTVNDKSIKMPLAPILFNDRALVPVREVFEAMDAEVTYDDNKKQVTLENDDTEIVITINSNTAYVNGTKKSIPDKLTPKLINKVGEDAKTMVPIRFLSETLGMKVIYEDETRNISVYSPDYIISDIVVLDAGHGGSDSGALGTLDGETIMEKDITLSVAKKVYDILKEKGVAVLMTRSKDVKPELSDRADFANEMNAGMFVSIHINSVDNPSPSGIETYYCKTNNEEYSGITSEQLAQDIQENLLDALDGKDRGVKTANFYVIRETKMPAILIELGFISNETELDNLCDEKYQQKAAEAIADGILKNLKELKNTAKKNGIDVVTLDPEDEGKEAEYTKSTSTNSSKDLKDSKQEDTASTTDKTTKTTENEDKASYPIKKDTK